MHPTLQKIEGNIGKIEEEMEDITKVLEFILKI